MISFAMKLKIIVVLICITISVSEGKSFLKCFKENVRSRHFAVNPGNYNPSTLTIEACRRLCGQLYDGTSYNYAALAQGRYCYCGDTLPAAIHESGDMATDCNVHCSGSLSELCGGKRFVSVLKSIIPIKQLVINRESPNSMIKVEQTEKLNVGLLSGPEEIQYHLKVVELGSETETTVRSAQQEHGNFTVRFILPGRHMLTASAGHSVNNIQEVSASSEVLTFADIGEVKVECPEYVGTGIRISCNASVSAGSGIRLSISYIKREESTELPGQTFRIADTLSAGVGSFLYDNYVAADITSDDHILDRYPVNIDGNLVAIQAHVMTTGQATFLILQPECPGGEEFCVESNQCQPSCVKTCTGFKMFCSTCVPGGGCITEGEERQPVAAITPMSSFTIKSSFTVDLNLKNLNVFSVVDAVEVKQGDVLAFSKDGSTAQIGMLADGDDLHTSLGTLSVGATFTSGHLAETRGTKSLFRGVVTKPTEVKFLKTFSDVGTYVVDVRAEDSKGRVSSKSMQTSVTVMEPIDNMVIECPPFGTTGLNFTCQVHNHIGSNVFYTYGYKNTPMAFNMSERSWTISIPEYGHHNVCVMAVNQVSSQFNCSEIMLLEAISGVTINSNCGTSLLNSTLTLDVSEGSNVKCQWSYAQSTQTGDPLTQFTQFHKSGFRRAPMSAYEAYHVFDKPGFFNVSVYCENHVSNESVNKIHEVQEIISGAEITPDEEVYDLMYVPVGTAFTLNGSVEQGNPVLFSFMFGEEEVQYSTQTIAGVGSYTYKSPGFYDVTLTASNTISSATASAEVIAQYPVTENFTLSCDTPVLYPNGVVEFELLYSGDPLRFPSEARASFDWGDGFTQKDVIVEDKLTLVSHQYMHQSENYGVSVNVYNKVSQKEFTAKCAVYLGIVLGNCTSRHDSTPGGPQMPPQEHPVSTPVRFYAFPKSGTLTHLQLEIFNTSGGLLHHEIKAMSPLPITVVSGVSKEPIPPLTYVFQEEGIFNITLNASSPISYDTVDCSVNVVGGISGITIKAEPSVTSVGERKTFIFSFRSLSVQSCLRVTTCAEDNQTTAFALGDHPSCPTTYYVYKGPLTNPVYINDTFYNEGMCTMNVIGFDTYNPSRTESLNFTFPISSEKCYLPKVNITLKVKDNIFKSSDIITIHGEVLFRDCPASDDKMNRSWTISMLNEDEKTYEEIDITDDSKFKGKTINTLQIEKATLKAGTTNNPKIYRVCFKCSMANYKKNFPPEGMTFADEECTFINVIPSELKGRFSLMSESLIEVGNSEIFTLNPKLYSIDPDDPENEEPFDTFEWRCREFTDGMSLDGGSPETYWNTLFYDDIFTDSCIEKHSGANGKVAIDPSLMDLNPTYVYFVKVYKGERSSVSMIQVRIKSGVIPKFQVRCSETGNCDVTENGIRWKTPYMIMIRTDCISACVSNISYQYSLQLRNGDLWNDLDNMDQYIAGQGSEEIALFPQLWGDLGFNANLRLVVTLNNGKTTSSKIINIEQNRPPYGGSCYVDRTEGVYDNDTFTLACQDWMDDSGHGIAVYKFYVLFNNSNQERVIYNGPDAEIISNLILGPSWDDYNMQLFCTVTDIDSVGKDYYIGVIKVTPPSDTEVSALLEAGIAALKEQEINANQEISLSQLTSVATMLSYSRNQDIKLFKSATARATSTGYTADNVASKVEDYQDETDKVEEEKQYMAVRESRSEMRGTCVKVLDQLSFDSMENLDTVTQLTALVTNAPEEISRETQNMCSSLLRRMSSSILVISKEQPPEKMKSVMQSTMAIMANIEEGCGIAVADPLTSDVQTITDESMRYDTDLESKQINLDGSALNLNDAMWSLRKYTNSEEQKASCSAMQTENAGVRNVIDTTMTSSLVVGATTTIKSGRLAMAVSLIATGDFGGESPLPSGTGTYGMPPFDDLDLDLGINLNDIDVEMNVESQSSFRYKYCANSEYISLLSSTISLSLKSKNKFHGRSETLPVKKSKNAIIIEIPRDVKGEEPTIVPSNITSDIPQYHTTVIHKFDFPKSGLSLHFELYPDSGKQDSAYLMAAKFNGYPNITAKVADFVRIVKSDNSDGRHLFFLSNVETEHIKEGWVSIGVREITEAEALKYEENPELVYSIDSPPVFTHNYSTRLYFSGCYYHDNATDEMSTKDVVVDSRTRVDQTVCRSTHLTSFGGGFVVVPNTIDWDFVFANIDFLKNPTLYVTQIVILVVFIITSIWARRQDQKDMMKLGMTPMSDNDPNDKYLYEVIVKTGSRKGSGTKSRVHMILSGDFDETDVRLLEDNERKVLKRGSTDSFLMAVQRPLGALNYMRIWHDNSGKGQAQSWYLSYITVRDMQTAHNFIFVADTWFAVEKEDGQIDRLFPVATEEQLMRFSHMFTRKTKKDLGDGHLWFSVVGRPAKSRFTRVQRVGCCLCLLYTTMLANAMFYEKGENSTAQTFTLGPFALSPEQISIGIASNIIVFPINVLLITLFKKARPRKKRPSRVKQALEEGERRRKENDTDSTHDENQLIKHACADSERRVSSVSGYLREPSRLSSGYHTDSMSGSDSGFRDNNKIQEKQKKKKQRSSWPWWCSILAWIILWLTVLTCAAFVTFYGIMFQDIKCKKWISSMFMSIFASVCLTQPLKVLLLAAVFSLLFKSKTEDDEEGEEDEEKHELQQDEEWLHIPEDIESMYGVTRPRKVPYMPPDPAILEQARILRMKELKMMDIIREILFYAFFLWILMVISYSLRDIHAYPVKDHLSNVFVNQRGTGYTNFNNVNSIGTFWVWVKSTLIPGLRADVWYNGDFPFGQRGFVADRTSRIMGYAIMRQARVKPGGCEVNNIFKDLFHQCNEGYSMLNEDTEHHGTGWQEWPSNETCSDSAYCYKTWSQLDSYPYLGQHNVYSGGGYVAQLRGSLTHLQLIVNRLEHERWVDKYTRAVFVEFTVYNPTANVFGIITLLTEILPTGGLTMSYRIEPVVLLQYFTGAMLFQITCEIIYVVFIIFFLVKEFRKLKIEKKKYFKEFWNWIEMTVIVLSVSAVVIFLYRMLVAQKLTAKFKETHGNAYMKFQYVGGWNELLTYIVGWLVFLATLKFIRLLRFNKRMSMLGSILRNSSRSLFTFTIMFFIMFFALMQLHYGILGTALRNYSTMIVASETLLNTMLGKFDFHEIRYTSPVLGPILFVLYICTISFLLMNMFISILNESCSETRVDINLQNNDYEIVEFMVRRLKVFLGLPVPPAEDNGQVAKPEASAGRQDLDAGSNPERTLTPHSLDDFPVKVNDFLDKVASIYYRNDPFSLKLEGNLEKIMAQDKPLSQPPSSLRQSYPMPPFLMDEGKANNKEKAETVESTRY